MRTKLKNQKCKIDNGVKFICILQGKEFKCSSGCVVECQKVNNTCFFLAVHFYALVVNV